ASPGRMIFSTGGFTFYGGLLVAGAAIAWYTRSKNLRLGLVADAFAPGLIIAYGIGRIGCHLAGDGDWGIASNLAARPSWIPMWLWAETYPNNILNIPIAEPGVYPTPIYEFAMAAVIFGILWSLRRHPFKPWWLFSLYLVFVGIERFLIEQIRVNNVFGFIGMQVTQAELISVALMIVGVVGLALTMRRRGAPEFSPAPLPSEAAR
ncbi:MAG TPA: prolipoprotein diacylglyceryl transferase family protein, partial [Rhodothermales bacterium]